MKPLTDEIKDTGDEGGRLGNFADPVGIVCRLISQGGTIGWSLLAMEVASRAVMPFDFALSALERKRRQDAPDSNRPTILVTGPPRSGTTLAHQLIHQYLDVSYFSNLNGLFPRSPVTSAKLFGVASNPPGETKFRSLYGNTNGLRGPNDGFHVWDHFLGHDRYRVDEQRLDDRATQLRQFVNAWVEVTGKPLISKNNRNTVAMQGLSRNLPNACFVVIKRDPFFIAQSLLRAREWVQGNASRAWGLYAKDVDTSDSAPDEPAAVDSVCDQVEEIMASIEGQLKEIDSQRWRIFDYEQVCENPAGFVREVADRWDIKLRPDRDPRELEPLQISRKVTVNPEVAERIRGRFGSSSFAMSQEQSAKNAT